MKRTKQVFHREGDPVPQFVSGLRQFDGEDIRKYKITNQIDVYMEMFVTLHSNIKAQCIDYKERMQENADRQKQMIIDQTREKNYQRDQEKQEEHEYAQQTEMLNRMRGMLEDENNQKRAQMMKELQEENKRIAREKREKEQNWKNNQERQNQHEIANVNNSDLMTENPGTTTSQHAEHRYVPYHFKGLTPQQKASIEQERLNQVYEKKQLNQMQAEEERQWAMQQEANRQLMMQNEIELKEKQRMIAMGLKTQHKGDKHVKDQKWTNHYGEQQPLPDLY